MFYKENMLVFFGYWVFNLLLLVSFLRVLTLTVYPLVFYIQVLYANDKSHIKMHYNSK